MGCVSSEVETAGPTRARHAIDPRYLQLNYGVLEGGAPVIIFWVANNLGPSSLAIVLSFLTAAFVFVRNRKSGIVRILSIVSFAIVAASAAAGLALNNDKAFAAQNIVSDVSFVVIGIVSLVIGKPFVGPLTRELIPALRPLLNDADRVFVILTVVNVLINVVQAIVRVWLLDAMSTNSYVVVSRVIGVPFNVAYFGLAYVLIVRRLDAFEAALHQQAA